MKPIFQAIYHKIFGHYWVKKEIDIKFIESLVGTVQTTRLTRKCEICGKVQIELYPKQWSDFFDFNEHDEIIYIPKHVSDTGYAKFEVINNKNINKG
jgi:hypothetical protein